MQHAALYGRESDRSDLWHWDVVSAPVSPCMM